MIDHPGRIPDAAELGLRAAAERLVGEYFARLDRADVDGLLELYADDATLQSAKGKEAIRQAITSSSAAVAGKDSPHIPTNIRAAAAGDGVEVDCTVVAYLREGPGPYPAIAILNQRQILKRSPVDGCLRIVDHQVTGFDLSQLWDAQAPVVDVAVVECPLPGDMPIAVPLWSWPRGITLSG